MRTSGLAPIAIPEGTKRLTVYTMLCKKVDDLSFGVLQQPKHVNLPTTIGRQTVRVRFTK
jgi:hypothetical protein